MGVGHIGCLEGHSQTLSGLNSGPQMCEQIIPQTPATMGGLIPVVIPPHHDGLYFQIRTHRKPTLPWVTCIITRNVTYSGTLKDKVICIRTIGKMPWEYFRTWQGSTHFRFHCIKLQTHLKNFEKRGHPSYPVQNRQCKEVFPRFIIQGVRGNCSSWREFIYRLGWQQHLTPSTW